jgi:hypothetical protein
MPYWVDWQIGWQLRPAYQLFEKLIDRHKSECQFFKGSDNPHDQEKHTRAQDNQDHHHAAEHPTNRKSMVDDVIHLL